MGINGERNSGGFSAKLQGISGDLLGICTELIGNDWESHAERSERASGAIDVFGRCGSRSELT